MDPNETLKRIASKSLGRGERSEAIDNLQDWLNHGGFQPDWSAHPEATHAYVKACGFRHGMPKAFRPAVARHRSGK